MKSYFLENINLYNNFDVKITTINLRFQWDATLCKGRYQNIVIIFLP